MASSHQDQEQESKDEIKQDHFNRLPDDLVMLIINKLIHVKTLIRFSVVSKRYSSLVFQTDSLFVDLDIFEPGFLGRLGRFLKNLMANFSRASTPNIESHNTQKLSVMKDGFLEIKHLHLHLVGSALTRFSWGSEPFTRFVAAFGSRFEFCHFLIASSVNQSNSNSSVGGSSNYYFHGYYSENSESLFKLLTTLLKTQRKWHNVIRNLVSDHKKLETVVISDDDIGGNFIMGKEQIARLQSNQEISTYPTDLYVSVTHVPTLDLSESGYTMNDVILVSAIPADQDGEIVKVLDTQQSVEVDFLDDSILDRWEVFDETIRLIVNKNRMPMIVSHLPCYVLQ